MDKQKINEKECPECGRKVKLSKSGYCPSCGREIYTPVMSRRVSWTIILIAAAVVVVGYLLFLAVKPQLYFYLDMV